GWEYDSGNYRAALEKAMGMIDYRALRKEQAEKRARGELMGIGIASFTEVVGAGPSRDYDILGIKIFDPAEIRIHPTGKAMARFGTKSQGQGHETTYAQIVAEELGLPAADVQVEEGDTDTAPYGLGTYASRGPPRGLGLAPPPTSRPRRVPPTRPRTASARMQAAPPRRPAPRRRWPRGRSRRRRRGAPRTCRRSA